MSDEIYTLDGYVALDRATMLYSRDNYMAVVENTCRWADPETYQMLDVWYPGFHRGTILHRVLDGEPMIRQKTGQPKNDGNRRARWTIWQALGYDYRRGHPQNWEACHIWAASKNGVRRPRNDLIRDRSLYSRLANIVLLPKPAHKWIDACDGRGQEITEALRYCAFHLYGWAFDTSRFTIGSDMGPPPANYPTSWPRPDRSQLPRGTVRFSPIIEDLIQTRLRELKEHKDCKVLGECWNPPCLVGLEKHAPTRSKLPQREDELAAESTKEQGRRTMSGYAHDSDADMSEILGIARHRGVTEIVSVCRVLNTWGVPERAKRSHGGSIRFGTTDVCTLMLAGKNQPLPIGEVDMRIVLERVASLKNSADQIYLQLKNSFVITADERKSNRKKDDRLERFVTIRIRNKTEAEKFLKLMRDWI